MATKKKSTGRKSSSGSDPKSKRIVHNKMGKTMHEFKHHELESGRSGRKVRNPKQAIAIGLSEARRSGADIPPSPNKKRSGRKSASKRGSSSTAKKSTGRKSTTKKSTAKKSTTKKGAAKKSTGRKSASTGRKRAAKKK